MEYVKLGKSGLKVSRLCLGMMTYGTSKWQDWLLSEDESRPFVQRALELGINFFDTADMYSLGVSEEITGRLLKEFASNREEVVVATKVFFPVGQGPNGGGLSRKHILEAIDNSLRRLGMDYVDLYQIHRWDSTVPIEETMESLNDVVRAGKARYIGASSMFAWQFAKAQYTADLNGWTRFVSMQNHLNLIYREEEREMLPLCKEEGVGVIPWSPLARGFLAGNRTRGTDTPLTTRAKGDSLAHERYYRPEDFDVAERASDVASRRGVTPAQISLAWLLQKPVVTAPIIGVTKLDHLEQAVAAVGIELSVDEVQQLEQLYRPHAILGHE
jgi:aryl-alcohol dehydrogenase (NADP+)